MKICFTILVLFASLVAVVVECRLFNEGWYSDHPAYRNDNPSPFLSRLIPFGLPRGGTSMKGMPFGLLAYAAKFGSWKKMLKYYQQSRQMERSYRMNSYGRRAHNSWSV